MRYLLAGVQRGIKAINMSGLNTLVHFDGMTRAPLIEALDIYKAQWLYQEVGTNKELLNWVLMWKDPL